MYVRRKDIVLGTFGGVIKERIVSPRRVASMKNVHIHSDPIRKFIMIIIHYSVHLVGLRCFRLEMCKDGRFQSKQIIITGLPKGYNDGHLLCIHLPTSSRPTCKPEIVPIHMYGALKSTQSYSSSPAHGIPHSTHCTVSSPPTYVH